MVMPHESATSDVLVGTGSVGSGHSCVELPSASTLHAGPLQGASHTHDEETQSPLRKQSSVVVHAPAAATARDAAAASIDRESESDMVLLNPVHPLLQGGRCRLQLASEI